MQIYKDPERFGISVTPEPRVHYETITVQGAADLQVLADAAGVEVDTLRSLNPALRRRQTAPSRKNTVHVPPGTGQTLLANLERVPRSQRVLYARHRVQRGDTLSTIASAYGVSVRSIQQTNGMGRRTMIRAGQMLEIPTGAARASMTTARAGSPRATTGSTVHRVRRGDTLSSIARRYGTTARAIAAANEISLASTLSIGQRLQVGEGASAAATPAAMPASVETVAYRVRRGDTLFDLAARYRTTPSAIASASGITTRSTLSIGQRLKIPRGLPDPADVHGPGDYTVRRGDNLWSIASSFQTTVDKICRLNRISKGAILYPGTVLRVR